MDNIKPCPVCGGPAVAVGKWHECADANCDMNGLPLPTWNRLSSQAARIAALEAELAPLRELWAAVEELGQAKQNTYALRTLAGDAWIVGSNGDGMEAITRPTLRRERDEGKAQGGEVEDA